MMKKHMRFLITWIVLSIAGVAIAGDFAPQHVERDEQEFARRQFEEFLADVQAHKEAAREERLAEIRAAGQSAPGDVSVRRRALEGAAAELEVARTDLERSLRKRQVSPVALEERLPTDPLAREEEAVRRAAEEAWRMEEAARQAAMERERLERERGMQPRVMEELEVGVAAVEPVPVPAVRPLVLPEETLTAWVNGLEDKAWRLGLEVKAGLIERNVHDILAQVQLLWELAGESKLSRRAVDAWLLAREALLRVEVLRPVDALVYFLDKKLAQPIQAGPEAEVLHAIAMAAAWLEGDAVGNPPGGVAEKFHKLFNPIKQYVNGTVYHALADALHCYGSVPYEKDGKKYSYGAVACVTKIDLAGKDSEQKCMAVHDFKKENLSPRGYGDALKCFKLWPPVKPTREEAEAMRGMEADARDKLRFRKNCGDFVRDLYVARSVLVRQRMEAAYYPHERMITEGRFLRADPKRDLTVQVGEGRALDHANLLYAGIMRAEGLGSLLLAQRGGTCGWNAMQNILALDLLMGGQGVWVIEERLGVGDVRVEEEEWIRDRTPQLTTAGRAQEPETLDSAAISFQTALEEAAEAGFNPAGSRQPYSAAHQTWLRVAERMAGNLNRVLRITQEAGVSAMQCQREVTTPRKETRALRPEGMSPRRAFYINRDWLRDGLLSLQAPVFHMRYKGGRFDLEEQFPLRGCVQTYLDEMRRGQLNRIFFYVGLQADGPPGHEDTGHAVSVALISRTSAGRKLAKPLVLFMDSSGFNISRGGGGEADTYGSQYQLLLSIIDRMACYVQHEMLPEQWQARQQRGAAVPSGKKPFAGMGRGFFR